MCGSGGSILIEDIVAFVSECRGFVSHLDQVELDQLSQMVRIDRKQRPLGLDVSERPDEVYRSKRIDSRYAALWVFIH